MLRLGAEASTVDLNGRGASDGPREEWERRCRAGITGHLGRFRQEPGFLMLFRDGPQGYPPLGSPLDGAQSGECRNSARLIKGRSSDLSHRLVFLILNRSENTRRWQLQFMNGAWPMRSPPPSPASAAHEPWPKQD
jgi:hypothetical protein